MQTFFLFSILFAVLCCILFPAYRFMIQKSPQQRRLVGTLLFWMAGSYIIFTSVLAAFTNSQSYGLVLYAVFACCGAVGAVLLFCDLRKSAGRKGRKLLLFAYLGVIFYITLFGRSMGLEHGTGVNMYILETLFPSNPYSHPMGLHFLQNIILFIPAGACMCMACEEEDRSAFKAFYYGCLLTVLIETMQGIFHLGLCDIDDMLSNILGCVFGYGVMEAAGYFLKEGGL